MQIALVGARRHKAAPGLSGMCPSCGSPMVPKCGERRLWHWAHGGVRHCDHWWEPETEWHRDWKNTFPVDWQEVCHIAENGEKHIADVKTCHGCVIEFQRSHLRPEERRAREEFYKQMAWVVDGLRAKRSKPSFYKALSLWQSPRDLAVSVPPNDCQLLRDWADSSVNVYFDFGTAHEDIERFGASVLWHFGLNREDRRAVLRPVLREHFLSAHLNGVPVTDLHGQPVFRFLRQRATQPIQTSFGTLIGFEKYLARKRRWQSLRHF